MTMPECGNGNVSKPTMKCSDSTLDDLGNGDSAQKVVEEKGWWKWMVLLGCVLINFINEGMFSSFGVLYTALSDYFGGSKGRISLIGSLNFSLPLIGGALASLIAGKFGCRFAAILGALVASAGIIASVFATSVVHLYLSFGFVAGLATSLPYIASVLILSQYFDQRLGFVNGVAECGACIGTIVLPVSLETLLTEYGWRGSLLLMAGLNLNIVVCGSLFTQKIKVQHTMTDDESSDEFTTVGEDIQTVEESTTSGGIDNTEYSVEGDQESTTCLARIEPFRSDHSDFYNGIGSDLSTTNSNLGSTEPQLITEGTTEHKHEPQERNGNGTESSAVEREHSDKDLHRAEEERSDLDLALDLPSGNPSDRRCEDGKDKIEGKFLDRKTVTTGDSFENIDPQATKQAEMSWGMTCCTTLRLDIFRNTTFVTYVVFVFVLHIFIDIPYVYLPDRGLEVGLSRQYSTLLLTTLGVMQLAGNLVFGYIGDIKRIDNVFVFGCCIVLSGTSLALVPLTQEFAPLAVCAGAFGFFTATADSMCSVMVVEFLGFSTLSTGYGYTMMVKGVSLLIGTPFGGWLHDITGDYDLTFYVAGGCLGVCGLLYTAASKLLDILRRRRKVQECHSSE